MEAVQRQNIQAEISVKTFSLNLLLPNRLHSLLLTVKKDMRCVGGSSYTMTMELCTRSADHRYSRGFLCKICFHNVCRNCKHCRMKVDTYEKKTGPATSVRKSTVALNQTNPDRLAPLTLRQTTQQNHIQCIQVSSIKPETK